VAGGTSSTPHPLSNNVNASRVSQYPTWVPAACGSQKAFEIVTILSSPDFDLTSPLGLPEPGSGSAPRDGPPIYIRDSRSLLLFSPSLLSFRSLVYRQYLGVLQTVRRRRLIYSYISYILLQVYDILLRDYELVPLKTVF
jgi:hypothetical protein